MKHLVPILDEGVSLDRGDHVIVVLDAVPVDPDTQRQLDTLCDLLGAPKRKETER